MPPARLSAAAAVAVAVVLAASGCGKKTKKIVKRERHPAGSGALAAPTAEDVATAPRVTFGAWSLPVPSGWREVAAGALPPGARGLETIRQPPVTLAVGAPAPTTFDPGDPSACATNGRALPGALGTPSVIELAVGKACVIELEDGGKRQTRYVIRAGDQAVTAECRFERPGDHGACDAIVRAITPAT